MRRTWLLGSMAAALGAALACSPHDDPFCPNGVWPFDGQTAVPLDVVIVVQTGEALPDDAPPLDGTITLTTEDGRAVPFTTEVDTRTGELRVIPDEALEPNTRYELGAVDWYQLAEYPHWWGRHVGRDYTLTHFATGSEPALLEALPIDDGSEVFVVAFSEPIELDSLEGLLWVTSRDGGSSASSPFDLTPPASGGPTELEVLGTVEGDPHLVEVRSMDGLLPFELAELLLHDGARSVTGERVPSASIGLSSLELGGADPIARFSGAPYCMTHI